MEKRITRRNLLKILLAGSGGVAAAAFLPKKWVNPVVESGVIPVHAQSSFIINIPQEQEPKPEEETESDPN